MSSALLRRWPWSVFAMLLISASVIPVVITAPPAQAQVLYQVSCDGLPDPITRGICRGGSTVVDGGRAVVEAGGDLLGSLPSIPSPTEIVSDLVEDAVTSILNQFAKAEVSAVAWVLGKQAEFINDSTTPTLTADWFKKQYAVVFGLGVVAAIILGYSRMAAGMKNQSAAEVSSAGFSLLAFLTLGGFLPLLVGGLVAAMDGPVTQAFLDATSSSGTQMLTDLREEMVTSIDGALDFILIPIIILIFGILGGVFAILQLFFREGAIYVFTAAEVLAFAMWVGGRWTNEIFEKVSMGLVGLILLKPIMAFIMWFGIGLLGSGGGADPIILGAVVTATIPLLSWAGYRGIAHHDIHPLSSFARGMNYLKLVKR